MEGIWGYGANAEALQRRVRFVNAESSSESGPSAGRRSCWQGTCATGSGCCSPRARTSRSRSTSYTSRCGSPSVDSYVLEARRRFGANPIPHKSFLYEVMRRDDSPRAYAMLADQTPLKRTPKHWLRFLNRDTAFFLGPERIARYLDASVVYVSMTRVRRGYYEVHLEEIAEPPYTEASGFEIATSYARRLEASIRASPADWLWIHNKWKYPRPADAPDDARAARAAARAARRA